SEGHVGVNGSGQTWAQERSKVMSLGFTADEADCWILVARAAQQFFELPTLHQADAQEVAEAVHAIQYRLMSRPTYRRYLHRDEASKP
ncbi:MAG TPA: hypothetical protein VFV10_02445, partial [Gammaproteobacteria bacterium]|nr:hypothetical protein [Gammaproteobacteria bacterium]